jgi:predicted MFS family arabinose efflux permease
MIACTIVLMLGNLGYAYAPNEWVLLASRFVTGIGAAGTTVARSYVGIATTVTERTSFMAALGKI